MAHTAASGVPIADHLARILGAVDELPVADVPLSDARGRVLAADVSASVSVPGFDNSAMDGYAVRRVDVADAGPGHPVSLRVVGHVAAGSAADPPMATGEAVRIMTGAPLPTDADAVIAQENTDRGTPVVRIHAPADARGNVRPTGSDVRVGDTVLTAGRMLDARDVAAAAAAGARTLAVRRAPRVAVLSTGDELTPPGGPLGRGQIHDSNSYLLEGAVAEAGGIPVRVGAVPDDVDELRRVMQGLEGRVDAFITSGGVSVGDHDVVKALLRTVGSMWFGTVRMQPGKPQGFGRWTDGTPVFTLPGNPVSVFVSFETFVRPALRRMQGCVRLQRPVMRAVAAEGWRTHAGRAQRMPVAIVAAASDAPQPLRVRPASRGGAASHLVASLAGADGLALVPEDVTRVDAGDAVDVILIRH